MLVLRFWFVCVCVCVVQKFWFSVCVPQSCWILVARANGSANISTNAIT